ncbi:MAG: ABC-type transport auxiliary lipoprotein family protein [Methylococcaceae bacterium]
MRILLSALLALFCTACSTPAKQPAVHDFGLPVSTQTGKFGVKSNITVNAPKWLQDNRIRYRLLYSSPTEVRFYTLDRWIAPPPELLEQQLSANEKYALVIKLSEFEQRFDSPDRARVVLDFFVEAYSSDNNHLIDTQGFHFERSTPTPDAAGAVSGLADLTRQSAERVQDWLKKLSVK